MCPRAKYWVASRFSPSCVLCLAVILGIYFYFKFKKKGVEETVVEGDVTVGLEPYNQDDDISLGIINKLDQVITETVPLGFDYE